MAFFIASLASLMLLVGALGFLVSTLRGHWPQLATALAGEPGGRAISAGSRTVVPLFPERRAAPPTPAPLPLAA
jgi:hypothetical protein